MLQHRVKEFKQLAKAAHKTPTAVHVHALRVLTRRWRAHLWLVPEDQRTHNIIKTLDKLKRLGRVLGDQREYDVALEDAARYGFKAKELQRRQKKAQKAVCKALSRKKRRRYSKWLKRAAADFAELPARILTPRILELRRRLDRSIAKPPLTKSGRHHLRIEAKRARYVLQNFHHEVSRLKKLQDHLGRWHDLTTVAPFANPLGKLTRDQKREWHTAKRLMRPALTRTLNELSTVAKELE